MLLFFASSGVKAQDYFHGVGAQVNYGLFRLDYTSSTVNSSDLVLASVPGIVYKASLGFEINNSLNFAVSSYPFIGFNLSLNSQSGGVGSFGAELPVLGELYIGDLDDGCFFIGAGLSAAFLAASDVWGGAAAGPILGPQFDIGGQFNLRNRLVGIRLAYTYGLNNTRNVPSDITINTDKRSMVALGGYYVIGQ